MVENLPPLYSAKHIINISIKALGEISQAINENNEGFVAVRRYACYQLSRERITSSIQIKPLLTR